MEQKASTKRRRFQSWAWMDKTGWGDGEWQHEPDKLQWVDPATGLDCLMVRSHLGNWCGYVGVEPEHPLYMTDYQRIDNQVSVHGGITYAALCDEENREHGICHIPRPGQPEALWWFGFDCGHAWDIMPKLRAELAEIAKMMGREPPTFYSAVMGEKYRTRRYVVDQCTALAAQIDQLAQQGINVGYSPVSGAWTTLYQIDAFFRGVASIRAEGDANPLAELEARALESVAAELIEQIIGDTTRQIMSNEIPAGSDRYVIYMEMVLSWLTNEEESSRRFDPLPEDHFTVTQGIKCAMCEIPFRAGDITVLVPVAPGDEEEVAKWKAGRAFTARAELIHHNCVQLLADKVIEYFEQQKRSADQIGDANAGEDAGRVEDVQAGAGDAPADVSGE